MDPSPSRLHGRMTQEGEPLGFEVDGRPLRVEGRLVNIEYRMVALRASPTA
jgi:hypothetical protein